SASDESALRLQKTFRVSGTAESLRQVTELVNAFGEEKVNDSYSLRKDQSIRSETISYYGTNKVQASLAGEDDALTQQSTYRWNAASSTDKGTLSFSTTTGALKVTGTIDTHLQQQTDFKGNVGFERVDEQRSFNTQGTEKSVTRFF